MSSNDAHLSEIFTSIQGEGLYLGERQLFIRFAGCNLSCDYCDTRQATAVTPEYRIERTAGEGDMKTMKNPVPLDELLQISAEKGKHSHSVSITGGEPLLQVDFLKNFLPELKKNGHKVYLETNGTLPKHLEEVIEHVDIISMDFKLASASKGDSYLKEHREFLEIASLNEVFVKAVVVQGTVIKEIDEAAKIVASAGREIPLVIQPAASKHRIKPADLLAWQLVAKKSLDTVRVIPQTHKGLGVL